MLHTVDTATQSGATSSTDLAVVQAEMLSGLVHHAAAFALIALLVIGGAFLLDRLTA